LYTFFKKESTLDFSKLFKKNDKNKKQEEKDDRIMDYFSGSNPNRKKVEDAIKKKKQKEREQSESDYREGGVKCGTKYGKLMKLIKRKK